MHRLQRCQYPSLLGMSVIPFNYFRGGTVLKLTVYFDGQFWVGIIEVLCNENLKVFRHIFGPEPNNQQILSFVSRPLPRILDRSRTAKPVDAAESLSGHPLSPKRAQRMAAKALKKKGIGTKAQNVMREAIHAHKAELKHAAKIKRETLIRERYLLRKEKAKQKHRGK
ncbi:DUF2992 family protein [Sporolactobacillus shoreae]|uniref:DUF2992 family protein n=1 Tax=Sporolactobacillus shoreae TaxID=1465501 RepID=A0A4Z0GLZ7_9BACL|nr:DUF2992 family protein [Sporolactobacillus shoreae]